MIQLQPYIKTLYENQKPDGIKYIFRKSWYPKAKAYVYLRTFHLDNQWWYYIGYHKITVDTEDKFYDFSSEVPLMKDLHVNSKCQKTVEVIGWGTESQMKQLESEELDKVKHRWWNNGKGDYFNQRNQYTTPNQISGIDYTMVEDVNAELMILKEQRVHEYPTLKILNQNLIHYNQPAKELASLPNIQVREIEIDTSLVKELKVVIQSQINEQRDISEGAKCTVTLEDRDFKASWDNKSKHYDRALICGKHTADSYGGNPTDKWYNSATLNEIRIPKEIHKDWNDMEVWKIANGDNSKSNSERPVTKDDIIREYKELVNRNLDWDTDVEKARVQKSLRSTNAWKNIKNEMESWELDKDRKSKGKGPRIAYDKVRNEVELELKKKNGNFTLDDLIVKVIEDDYVIDEWNVGPYTTNVVNPYVQLSGAVNKKIFKIYSNKSNSQKEKLVGKFFKNVKLIKYWLYYPTPEAKRKFNNEHSHRVDLFELGNRSIFKHEYDYEILPEFKETLT
jgi:hypothetical protein